MPVVACECEKATNFQIFSMFFNKHIAKDCFKNID